MCPIRELDVGWDIGTIFGKIVAVLMTDLSYIHSRGFPTAIALVSMLIIERSLKSSLE